MTAAQSHHRPIDRVAVLALFDAVDEAERAALAARTARDAACREWMQEHRIWGLRPAQIRQQIMTGGV